LPWQIIFTSATAGELATGSYDGMVKIMNTMIYTSPGNSIRAFHQHRFQGPISALNFSPDGEVLCSGGFDPEKRIHFWSPQTRRPLYSGRVPNCTRNFTRMYRNFGQSFFALNFVFFSREFYQKVFIFNQNFDLKSI